MKNYNKVTGKLGKKMQTKFLLDENEMPKQWYNIQADLPKPLDPPLDPATGEPIGPEALAPLFPMEIIKQEVSQERWIDIPDEVNDILKLWRPSPLYQAHRLEKALGTPAKIFYKYEGVSPPGSHKPNTAVAQAYYNMKEGTERITTETGAGQWGSALAFSCRQFDLDCTVYMVKVSYEQKPYRKSMMRTWGAEVFASPTNRTNAGRSILEQDPNSPGSLGIAISEAVEDAATSENTKYSLGSVLNHVLMHQTVIGLETKKQLEMAEVEKPDIVIGCVGGGSNFSGMAFPFVKDKLDGADIEIIGVEPTACPTMTKGPFTYDFGDTVGATPLFKMFTLGHNFIPPGIHAGGLRYHGMAPLVSAIADQGLMKAESYHQLEVFEAAVKFARTEGIIVAPETAHAVKSVIDKAIECKKNNEEKTIVFNLSGHGLIDLAAYDKYFEGELQNYDYPEEKIKDALKGLPQISGASQ